MIKRYSYHAYPTPTQVVLLNKTFGSTRVVYNKYIETNLTARKLVTYAEACRNLTSLKQDPNYEWLNEVSSTALQQSLKDATQGVKNYYKNRKHFRLPSFKKRGNRQSFRITGEANFRVTRFNKNYGGVLLPKMGYLKYRMERDLPSMPSSVTVIREPSGEYQVSFVIEVNPTPLPKIEKAIGLDVGLTSYLTSADTEGSIEKVINPKYYRQSEEKLKKLQRVHSRKQKGSKNREKARVKLAKQHARVGNQRKDFINKLVLNMVRENQAIITEHLDVKNMSKNHNLAKSIMDAGWSTFITSISNKSEETGRTHILAPRFYPSSKTCSKCGVVKEELGLNERTYECAHCGVNLDRDVNAAFNLLELAVGSYHKKESIIARGEDVRPGLIPANLEEAGTINQNPDVKL